MLLQSVDGSMGPHLPDLRTQDSPGDAEFLQASVATDRSPSHVIPLGQAVQVNACALRGKKAVRTKSIERVKSKLFFVRIAYLYSTMIFLSEKRMWRSVAIRREWCGARRASCRGSCRTC